MTLASRAVLALTGLLAAAPLSAQETQWDNTVSFSPILALLEVVVVDYERRVGPEASIGLGLGYLNYDDGAEAVEGAEDSDATYFALDLKGRFYPDRAFKGLELGASLGLARVGFEDETGEESDATGIAYGVEVGHAWLLGDNERWFLGAAIGAKRFWFGEDDEGLPTVLPTGRLSFGVAF